MISTKAEVLNYIKDETYNVDLRDTNNLTTFNVAQTLSISRSLASQYLNELHRENALVKIVSRPVVYLHKKTLLLHYDGLKLNQEYLSMAQLRRVLSSISQVGDFKSLIGYNGSLSKTIKMAKNSITYSDKGIPLLLLGNNGVGKTSLVKEMFHYAIRQEKLQDNAEFFKLDLNNDSDQNIEAIIDDLAKLSYDFLYVANINYLSENSLKRLIDYLVLYKPMFVVSASTEDLDRYEKYFPVISILPDYKDRYMEERKNIVLQIFQKQAAKLKTDIETKESIIFALAKIDYKHNISDLEKLILRVCARAISDSNNETLQVQIHHLYGLVDNNHLSEYVNKYEDEKFTEISELVFRSDILVDFYERLIDEQFENPEIIENYLDYIINNQDYDKKHIADIKKELISFMEVYPILKDSDFIKQIDLFSRLIYSEKVYNNITAFVLSEKRNTLLKVSNDNILKNPNLYSKINYLKTQLSNYLDLSINDVNINVLLKALK